MPPVSVRTLVIAGVLGVPVALAAVGFTSLVHGAELLLWDEAGGWAIQSRVVSESIATVIARISAASSPGTTSTP
jgi:hypothetical protein